MLILARKVGQSILIGDDIEITVTEVRGDQVRLGINAPRSVSVKRRETIEQVRAQNVEAAHSADEAARTIEQALKEKGQDQPVQS